MYVLAHIEIFQYNKLTRILQFSDCHTLLYINTYKIVSLQLKVKEILWITLELKQTD